MLHFDPKQAAAAAAATPASTTPERDAPQPAASGAKS